MLGILACVVAEQDEDPKLEDIPIVREFGDVFLNKLSGMPTK
jgi:hypothetical protein